MAFEKIKLTEEQEGETYLPTLYGKALDFRAENPILGDKLADEVVRHIDLDFEKKFKTIAQGGAITRLDLRTGDVKAIRPRQAGAAPREEGDLDRSGGPGRSGEPGRAGEAGQAGRGGAGEAGRAGRAGGAGRGGATDRTN